jgi:hypothetical protein
MGCTYEERDRLKRTAQRDSVSLSNHLRTLAGLEPIEQRNAS